MKKLLSILLFTPIIIFAQQSEDVVYLKAGSIIRGLIIEQVQNSYKKVQSGQNVFVYQIDEIEKMTKEILRDKTLSNNPIGGGSSFSFTKGIKSISGNVSYYNFFYDGKDMGTSLTIAPSIGYFLNDNFSANIGLNFTSKNNDDYSSSNNAISIGCKLRTDLYFSSTCKITDSCLTLGEPKFDENKRFLLNFLPLFYNCFRDFKLKEFSSVIHR